MTAHTVYCAGPWVFAPFPAEIGERLSGLCKAAGLVAVLPYDGEGEGDPAGTIYRQNLDRISRSDAVVADISPFRGPHLDVGTAFELGYAVALRKPVFAYSCSPTPLIQRIWCEDTKTGWRDAHGKLVEDFQLPDNLMIGKALSAPAARQARDAIAAAAKWLGCHSTINPPPPDDIGAFVQKNI